MHLLRKVRRTIRQHRLAAAEARVLAAVSGGSDSVALAHLLTELAAAGELQLAGIAHFNHQLRATADRDEAFCRDLATSLSIPIEVSRGDVAARAAAGHRSIEEAARGLRYEFFEAARMALGADVVALGHTRDDQAETFLLRMIGGAGARGLASMYPRNGVFVRPLLDCRRHELIEWLTARELPFVVDETNADVSIPRNRVRAELVPLLERRFNPAVVDVLAREAEIARDEWEWMSFAAESSLAAVAGARDSANDLSFDVAALGAIPLALRRLVLWRALGRRGARVTFEHADRLLALADLDRSDGCADFPGQTAERIGPRLVLRDRTGATRTKPGPNLFEYPLSIPGEVLVPEAGCVVSAETASAGPTDRTAVVVRREPCGGRLIVRNRRPGDRFRGVGRRRRKLQDLFVDSKIDRRTRDRIPLITSESGAILWVAGYGVAEEFQVTDPSQAVLILRLRQVPGGSA